MLTCYSTLIYQACLSPPQNMDYFKTREKHLYCLIKLNKKQEAIKEFSSVCKFHYFNKHIDIYLNNLFYLDWLIRIFILHKECDSLQCIILFNINISSDDQALKGGLMKAAWSVVWLEVLNLLLSFQQAEVAGKVALELYNNGARNDALVVFVDRADRMTKSKEKRPKELTIAYALEQYVFCLFLNKQFSKE